MNIFKVHRLCVIFIAIFFCFGIYSDEDSGSSSHFGTHTVYHENGDTTVTYEHSGCTEHFDYQYTATFEHVTYDTTEFTAMTHAEFSCTPRDDINDVVQDNHNDQQEIPESYQENSWRHDDGDYKKYLNDMAMDREYNRQVDQLNQNSVNDHNTSHRTASLISSYDYDSKRSIIYQMFKGTKESIFGKSKRTKERDRAQKISWQQEAARKQAQQKIAEEQRLQRQQELTSELEQAYEQTKKL